MVFRYAHTFYIRVMLYAYQPVIEPNSCMCIPGGHVSIHIQRSTPDHKNESCSYVAGYKLYIKEVTLRTTYNIKVAKIKTFICLSNYLYLMQIYTLFAYSLIINGCSCLSFPNILHNLILGLKCALFHSEFLLRCAWNSLHSSHDHCQNNPVTLRNDNIIVMHDYSIRVI